VTNDRFFGSNSGQRLTELLGARDSERGDPETHEHAARVFFIFDFVEHREQLGKVVRLRTESIERRFRFFRQPFAHVDERNRRSGMWLGGRRSGCRARARARASMTRDRCREHRGQANDSRSASSDSDH
jgi:hypothetical protein